MPLNRDRNRSEVEKELRVSDFQGTLFKPAEGAKKSGDRQVRKVINEAGQSADRVKDVLGNMLSKFPPLQNAAKLKAFNDQFDKFHGEMNELRGKAPVAKAVDEPQPEAVQPKNP